MTLLGMIVCSVGIIGYVVNYMGLAALPGILQDQKLWIGLAVIGGVTAMLTRRARD